MGQVKSRVIHGQTLETSRKNLVPNCMCSSLFPLLVVRVSSFYIHVVLFPLLVVRVSSFYIHVVLFPLLVVRVSSFYIHVVLFPLLVSRVSSFYIHVVLFPLIIVRVSSFYTTEIFSRLYIHIFHFCILLLYIVIIVCG